MTIAETNIQDGPSRFVGDVETIFVQSDACVARLRLAKQCNLIGTVQ